jgi:hypothetical protein
MFAHPSSHVQLAFANFRETKDTFIRNRDLARGCQNYIKKGNELEDAVKFLCVAEKLREFTRLPARYTVDIQHFPGICKRVLCLPNRPP